MTTFEISLPDALREFIECQVASGDFPDASAYMQSLLEQARLEQERARIDALVLKGIKDVENGNGVEMTPEDWKQMRDEYLEHSGSRNGS